MLKFVCKITKFPVNTQMPCDLSKLFCLFNRLKSTDAYVLRLIKSDYNILQHNTFVFAGILYPSYRGMVKISRPGSDCYVVGVGTGYYIMIIYRCDYISVGGDYPNFEILRSIGSLSRRMRRPSTVISFSATKPESVRMALEVVMLERLARSSRAMYMRRVMLSSSKP